jgi:hypothetical protein
MKTTIKKSLQSLLMVPALALAVSAVAPVAVHAQVDCTDPTTGGVRGGVDCASGTENASAGGFFEEAGMFRTIVNTLLFIIGAISVIMIIFGGFKYVTSGGDSNGVTSAKNTILYAVIGLIVAVLAFAIIDFVLDSLGK